MLDNTYRHPLVFYLYLFTFNFKYYSSSELFFFFFAKTHLCTVNLFHKTYSLLQMVHHNMRAVSIEKTQYKQMEIDIFLVIQKQVLLTFSQTAIL